MNFKCFEFQTGYVEDLMALVWELRAAYPSYSKAKVLVGNTSPDNISSTFEKKDKQVLIEKYQSRFTKK